MKSYRGIIQNIVLFVLVAAAATVPVEAQNSSTIFGHVFDAQNRQPVGDLYIELQDTLGRTLSRTRVNSTGSFGFRGLRGGTYNIKVLTFGTNYQETIQEVRLISFPLGRGRYSSDMANVDIYLTLDSRKVKPGSGGAASVVFVQEVPDEARKLYKKGVEELEDKKDTGLDSLKKALQIFPTYYDALDRLGSEYVLRQQYAEAAPYLVKAIDVNQRSYSSFYALGVAAYNLKDLQSAIKALGAAVTINPRSINAKIFYGMVLRIDGQYAEAEKFLLQAKSLADKNSPVSEIHWQLALLYEKTGRYAKAADELEQYLKIEPGTKDGEKIKRLIADLRTKSK